MANGAMAVKACREALKFVGKSPYAFGAAGEYLTSQLINNWERQYPASTYQLPRRCANKNIRGFDCSGLVGWAYKVAGYMSNTRTSTYALKKMGTPVSLNSMKPGDILITNNDNHVVMYIGGGKVVEAQKSETYVKISSVPANYTAIRRFDPSASSLPDKQITVNGRTSSNSNSSSSGSGSSTGGSGNKVIATGVITVQTCLHIRTGPSTSYGITGYLYNGNTINIYEIQGDWCRHDSGWSCIRSGSAVYIQVTEVAQDSVSTVTEEDNPPDEYYSKYLSNNYDTVDAETASTAFLKTMKGVHGMPYQFMPSVDRRIKNSVFGRKYASKIITKLPVLLLTPGRPLFMKGFTKNEKENILKYAASKSLSDNSIDAFLDSEGKFYSFQPDYSSYYDYVNPMLQAISKFLGINNKKIDGKQLENFTWQNYANSAFTNFISAAEVVAFYIDSEKQISESFSNDTGQSALSEKVNSLSELGREVQFLLGGVAGAEFDTFKQENYDATLEEFNSFTDKYLGVMPDSFMKKLTSGFLTVAVGGKMLFPEIWNDSSFSRTYSINIKLRSPDADPFSLYMNILVPLIHLICLAAPQQMGVNAYKSPFLVRGYYKGFFNIDMGIITSMSITKGDQGKWTSVGLPTEIDVSFDLKDLYQMLTITQGSNPIQFLSNTSLMDYLANLCGINIAKPDILRSIDLYVNLVGNNILDNRADKTFLKIEQTLAAKLEELMNIFNR